jgi:hypothetical protein
LHPLERRDLVQQAAVGRRSFHVPEAFQPDPVVEGHHYDAATCEVAAVVLGQAGHAERVGTALNPHHYRQPAAKVGRPHVDRQPVVAFFGQRVHAEHGGLRGWRPEPRCLPHAIPGLNRLRRTERHGWRRVRDATEHCEVRLRFAADNSTGDLDVDVHTGIIAITTFGAQTNFPLTPS